MPVRSSIQKLDARVKHLSGIVFFEKESTSEVVQFIKNESEIDRMCVMK